MQLSHFILGMKTYQDKQIPVISNEMLLKWPQLNQVKVWQVDDYCEEDEEKDAVVIYYPTDE